MAGGSDNHPKEGGKKNKKYFMKGNCQGNNANNRNNKIEDKSNPSTVDKAKEPKTADLLCCVCKGDHQTLWNCTKLPDYIHNKGGAKPLPKEVCTTCLGCKPKWAANCKHTKAGMGKDIKAIYHIYDASNKT